jgi:hypothetical protein
MVPLPSIFLSIVLIAAASAHAASVSPVAWSGMPTSPGTSTNIRFTGFSNLAVNDTGTVAFNASVRELVAPPWVIPLSVTTVKTNTLNTVLYPVPAPTPTPLFTNSWDGIWTIDVKGGRKLVVRTGFDGYPFIVDAGGFGSLGAPLLNNSNLCAYSGNYSPGYIFLQPPLPGTPVTNFLSVYGGQGVWTSLNTPTTPAVFVGQTAPGYTNPFTTSVGTLEWLANLGSTNGNRPTNPSVTFTNWPSFTSIDGIMLPDTGRLVFSAIAETTNYYNPPVSTNGQGGLGIRPQTLLQRGIWGQNPQGRLVTIVREGEPLSFGKSNRVVATLAPETLVPGGSNRPFFSAGSMNPSGDVAVSASFTDGSQAIVVASARSNSLSIASMTGDSAPVGANKDFFLSFSSPSINSAGHVAFLATAGFVTQFPIVYSALPAIGVLPTNPTVPAPSYTNSWSGLWAEDASGNVKLITRIAPPVPDMGGFSALSNPIINSRHEVAFQGTYRQGFIRIPAGSFSGGIGVWTSRNLANPVAWIGQTAPGYSTNFTVSVKSPYGWSTNMITFRSTPPILSSIDRIAFPDTGRLVIWATASATNWVPRPPVPKGMVVTQEIRSSVLTQRGIWIQNSRGTLDLALREGMSVSVNGTSKVISSLPLPPTATPASGQETLCSRSNGIVVTSATFTDGTQAILRITP